MTAPLLLDTCAAIYIFDDEAMDDAAVAAMDHAFDAGIPTYVSPITAWEIAMLIAKRRFRSVLPANRWFHKLMQTPGFRVAEMSPDILMASWTLLETLSRDPADRIIAATAREYGFTVMTRDRALLTYAKEGHLSALAC
jgi:PIN domain nuclease of toxin-antitoxin system